MKFKILQTTDEKHIGEVFEHDEYSIKIGDTVSYKELSLVIDKIVWINDTCVKLSNSNYVVKIEILG